LVHASIVLQQALQLQVPIGTNIQTRENDIGVSITLIT